MTKHVQVEDQFERAGSQRSQLAQHDVFCHTRQVVALSKSSSIQQDVHGLFERASHQGAGLHSIDTVTSDGHQVASVGHHVGQRGQVTIVDVRTIERNHVTNFREQSSSRGFDSQTIVDFSDVVGSGGHSVDVSVAQHRQQVGSFGDQLPRTDGEDRAFVVKFVTRKVLQVHFSNACDSSKSHRV